MTLELTGNQKESDVSQLSVIEEIKRAQQEDHWGKMIFSYLVHGTLPDSNRDCMFQSPRDQR